MAEIIVDGVPSNDRICFNDSMCSAENLNRADGSGGDGGGLGATHEAEESSDTRENSEKLLTTAMVDDQAEREENPEEDPNVLTAEAKNTATGRASFFGNLRKSETYKVLFFVQPTHLIMIFVTTLIAVAILPDNTNITSNSDDSTIKPKPFVNFVYLAAFCTHVGAQFWMTFISGLSLYFNLNTHAFGDVQKILFPKYFTLNSALSAITIVQFIKMHAAVDLWDARTCTQLFVLTLCLLLELTIRLFAVPPLLRLMTVKTAIEKSAGVGDAVGRSDPGRLVHCPHYMAIRRAFRKLHLCVAMGNVITMMCTVFHLVYIAF